MKPHQDVADEKTAEIAVSWWQGFKSYVLRHTFLFHRSQVSYGDPSCEFRTSLFWEPKLLFTSGRSQSGAASNQRLCGGWPSALCGLAWGKHIYHLSFFKVLGVTTKQSTWEKNSSRHLSCFKVLAVTTKQSTWEKSYSRHLSCFNLLAVTTKQSTHQSFNESIETICQIFKPAGMSSSWIRDTHVCVNISWNIGPQVRVATRIAMVSIHIILVDLFSIWYSQKSTANLGNPGIYANCSHQRRPDWDQGEAGPWGSGSGFPQCWCFRGHDPRGWGGRRASWRWCGGLDVHVQIQSEPVSSQLIIHESHLFLHQSIHQSVNPINPINPINRSLKPTP